MPLVKLLSYLSKLTTYFSKLARYLLKLLSCFGLESLFCFYTVLKISSRTLIKSPYFYIFLFELLYFHIFRVLSLLSSCYLSCYLLEYALDLVLYLCVYQN